MHPPTSLPSSQRKHLPTHRNDRLSELPAGLHVLMIPSVGGGSHRVRGEGVKDGLAVLQITAPERSSFFSISQRPNFLSVRKVGTLLVPSLGNGHLFPSIPPGPIARWRPSTSRYDPYVHRARLVFDGCSDSLCEPKSQLAMGSVPPRLSVPTR